MAFPERLLADGEEVVAELRPHWIFLGKPLFWSILLAAASVAVAVAFPSAPWWVLLFPGVPLILALLWLAGRWLRRATSAVVLTNLRVIQRAGVIARTGVDVRLDRIRDTSSHQRILDRLLRAGDLVLDTGGDEGVVVLHQVRRPAEVQRLITDLVEERLHPERFQPRPPPFTRPAGEDPRPAPGPGWSGSAAPDQARPGWARPEPARFEPVLPGTTPPRGTPAGRPPTVGERLVELQELHRRGLVSDEEYEAKRRTLLDQL